MIVGLHSLYPEDVQAPGYYAPRKIALVLSPVERATGWMKRRW